MFKAIIDLGGRRGLNHMLKYLTAHPERGLLGYETMGFASVQYWRSFEHLEAFAKDTDDPHLEAWRKFWKRIGGSGRTGIWHETYLVRDGEYEAIYGNMPPRGRWAKPAGWCRWPSRFGARAAIERPTAANASGLDRCDTVVRAGHHDQRLPDRAMLQTLGRSAEDEGFFSFLQGRGQHDRATMSMSTFGKEDQTCSPNTIRVSDNEPSAWPAPAGSPFHPCNAPPPSQTRTSSTMTSTSTLSPAPPPALRPPPGGTRRGGRGHRCRHCRRRNRRSAIAACGGHTDNERQLQHRVRGRRDVRSLGSRQARRLGADQHGIAGCGQHQRRTERRTGRRDRLHHQHRRSDRHQCPRRG